MSNARSTKLADALVRRLAPHMPTGYSVRQRASMLLLYHDSEIIETISALDIADDADSRSPIERAATAMHSTLEAVQDGLSRDLRTPWPQDAEGRMVLPDVLVANGEIQAFFGEENNPVLRLQPIGSAEIEP
jgi:hypothetical protein